jgi:hypothetical protein
MPYSAHPDIRTPADTTVLWRYMDFAKFVEILENNTQWFARLDQFEDPLEGLHTDGEMKSLRKNLDGNSANQLIDAFRSAKSSSYINCWRSGSYESLAMWDLYGQGSGIIAIKSTVGKLKESLTAYNDPIYISKVKYMDWSKRQGLDNILVAASRKDLSYEHEAEVRAIFCPFRPKSSNNLEAGEAVAVDIKKLITEVVVGPREQSWVARLVKRVMKKYELSHPIVVSNRLALRHKI